MSHFTRASIDTRIPTHTGCPCNIQVRHRSRSGLKHINSQASAAFLFPAEEARHDRLKMHLIADVVLDDAFGPGKFAAELQKLRAPVFRMKRSPGRKFLYVDVLPDRWLLAGGGGHMWWNEKQNQARIDICLDLNPIRFLAHQQTSDLDHIDKTSAPSALRRRPDVDAELKCLTLDGNSNFLADPDRLGGVTFDHHDAYWCRLLTIYLGKLQSLIADQFSQSGVRLSNVELDRVVQAEVCWEFEHADALAFVSDLRRTLFAASSDAIWRRYSPYLEAGGELNSDSILIPQTQDIAIRFYAKALDRVRVEVIFKSRIREEIVRAELPTPAVDVLEMLTQLRYPAARRLQRLWAELDLARALPDPVAGDLLIEFMAKVAQAARGHDLRRVFSLLCNRRGITASEGHASIELCLALQRAGLVTLKRTRMRGPARFVLEPSYSAALDRYLRREECPIGRQNGN